MVGGLSTASFTTGTPTTEGGVVCVNFGGERTELYFFCKAAMGFCTFFTTEDDRFEVFWPTFASCRGKIGNLIWFDVTVIRFEEILLEFVIMPLCLFDHVREVCEDFLGLNETETNFADLGNTGEIDVCVVEFGFAGFGLGGTFFTSFERLDELLEDAFFGGGAFFEIFAVCTTGARRNLQNVGDVYVKS